MTDLTTRAGRIKALKAAAKERILILDGSWGVMFQKKKLQEADYRAERFADYDGQMKGNNDILCLTRPDLVAELHDAYFAAGADISKPTPSRARPSPRPITVSMRPPCATSTTRARASAARWPTAGTPRIPPPRSSSPARSGR